MKVSSILTCIFISAMAHAQPGLEQLIDVYTNPLVETNNYSGNILISRNGKVLFKKSYGWADRENGKKVTEETVFQIASVSKAITATAIMRLVQKGLLSLQQPLSDIIPDYPRGNEITVHHLLTHTSGIANINDLPVYDSLEQLQHTPEDLIPWFKNEPFEFEPGEKYGYSNSNYTLLAYILELYSGRSYGEYLSEDYFVPFQMEYTGHSGPMQSEIKNMAVGYEPKGISESQPARTINWTVKTGNGSLYSTTDDLQIWATRFFSGDIVNDSILKQMMTPHADRMGYGWFISPRNGKKQYHINGRSPGYTSVVSYYPDSSLLIIILSNNYVPVPTQMSIDFASMVFQESYTPLIQGSGKASPEQIKKFSGSYQFGPDFYQPNAKLTVTDQDGYLAIEWGGLYSKGGDMFIHRDYWSDVKFEQGDNGQVVMKYDRFVGTRIQ